MKLVKVTNGKLSVPLTSTFLIKIDHNQMQFMQHEEGKNFTDLSQVDNKKVLLDIVMKFPTDIFELSMD